MTIKRRQSRKIYLGNVPIGGGAPVSVQSMTKTDTRDTEATLKQIRRVAAAGCDIIRVAVPDEKAANSLPGIVEKSPIPVIADIHFNPELAIMSLDARVHGLRLNPGNIKNPDRIREIAEKAGEKNVPVRVGVNSGSLPKDMRKKVGEEEMSLVEAMVESAMRHVKLLESFDFNLIKIALKSSDPLTTIMAYRLMSERCDYPFHVGVTEAGTWRTGVIKSCVGIGTLLVDGLVDTLRVSLTADPEEEVFVGVKLLQSVGLKKAGPELISCPTCGRVEIDLRSLAERVERALLAETEPIKVAVMGCVVNGPGEAREADVGIAGGKGEGVIFRKGEIVKKVPEDQLFDALMEEIKKVTGDKG